MMNQQENFLSNIKDIFGSFGEKWLSELPQIITDLEHEWDFTFFETIPHLTYSFVVKVKMSDGRFAILKLSPPHSRCDSEIAWLQSNLVGAAQLLKSDSSRGALLMKQLVPGYSAKKLVKEGDDNGATRAIAQVIRTLNPNPIYPQIFKHVKDLSSELDHLKNKVDSKLLIKAKSIFSELTTDSSKDRLLHGDLHHDNILFSDNQWLAIDPHGYIGPAAFEVGAMIRNPYDCFSKITSLKKFLENRIRILQEELPFERYEIQGWAFAYTLMATGWSVIDHGEVPKSHIEIAEALNELI